MVHLEGIGWWSSAIADWPTASALLREDLALPTSGEGKPAARILPPNERRRAPEPVLIACEVAAQACTMAERDPAELPCVFASMHGDLSIIDSICATLAANPNELSPTQFHNSVHNAPVGYWTVATGCHAGSSAGSAWHGSFAAGLLEAAVEVVAESTPVLFVAADIGAPGPLVDIVRSPSSFGVALVLAPERTARTLATLRLRHEAHETPKETRDGALLNSALPLLAALAKAQSTRLHLPDGATSMLAIAVAA